MALTISNNQADWNRFVLENGGGFLQSWEWGKFQELVGRKISRCRVDSATDHLPRETIGQFFIIQNSLPLGQSYLYVPGGPLPSGADYRSEAWRACVLAVANARQQSGAIFARIEPFAIVGEQLTDRELQALGFHSAGQVQPSHTSMIDLSLSESELLAAMKQKTRYNIRLAEKHAVKIREADYSDEQILRQEFEAFWRLLTETTQRDNFRAHERLYYEKMLEALSPRADQTLAVRLLFADFQRVPVAAALISQFGDTTTFLHGASAAQYRQIMAPYFLHWSIIKQAKAAGFKKYDFWGVAPENAPENHPWSGITRFKIGFGGRRISCVGAWDLPGSRFWYALYKLGKFF
jgi:lipid II:glycine glycyltransferase (peptidoglycan interpeptide bridge formation enzyme)